MTAATHHVFSPLPLGEGRVRARRPRTDGVDGGRRALTPALSQREREPYGAGNVHRHTGERRYPLLARHCRRDIDEVRDAVDPGAGAARPVLSLSKGRDDPRGENAR